MNALRALRPQYYLPINLAPATWIITCAIAGITKPFWPFIVMLALITIALTYDLIMLIHVIQLRHATHDIRHISDATAAELQRLTNATDNYLKEQADRDRSNP